MMFADLPPPDPAIEMLVASRGMSKGIAQTDGPQMVVRGLVRFGDLQTGMQWKNLTQDSGGGEGSVFISGTHRFGSLQLSGGVAYKFQTHPKSNADSKSWEFTAGASRKFGPATLRATAIYSPDDLGSARRSLFVEGGPAVQLGKGWTASAAIGHRSRENGSDYTAFNLGVGKTVHRVQLDLRYYDTDRSGLGAPFRARLVASARLAF